MKIKITFLSLLAVSAAMIASAQVVEYDDMYFNSKDRAKAQASKPLTLKNISNQHEVATAINPTDSYSARNVNPEYISQSTVNPSGSAEPAPYFIPDYTPTAINQNLNGSSSSSWNNCNCAMAGGIPYYGMMPGGFGSYGSPFGYGNSMYGYDPYGYGGYNSFNSGWSSMMSIGFGMGMGSYYPYGGSSWGMGYGMGMGGYPLMNYGFNYYGGGYGYGYNNYYPGNVVIINNGDYNSRGVAYGKRASRSSDLNNTINSNNRTATMVTTDSQGRVRGSNGRVSGDTNSGSYYQSGWRTNPETSTTRSSNWSNSGRSGESNGRSNTTPFFENSGGSRSNMGGGNSNFSSGGGSRSSGTVSGGSGSSSGASGARRGRD